MYPKRYYTKVVKKKFWEEMYYMNEKFSIKKENLKKNADFRDKGLNKSNKIQLKPSTTNYQSKQEKEYMNLRTGLLKYPSYTKKEKKWKGKRKEIILRNEDSLYDPWDNIK